MTQHDPDFCGQPISESRRRLIAQTLGAGAIGMLGLTTTAFAASSTSDKSNAQGNNMYAYVGSRTTRERNARGDGISIFKVNAENGKLELVNIVKDLVNPSFLGISKNGKYLYTVHGDLSDISAFEIDKATGGLRFINRQSTKGKNPVHLAIDPSGKYIVVSNHLGSSLAVLPLGTDGSLGEVSQLVELTGPLGPHRVEQKLSKPHFNPFDPSGKFVIVPDKGLDRTFSFRFADGKLTPAKTPLVVAREGSGPRHLAFHPSGKFAYIVNELDSTVTTYTYAIDSGELKPLQILSTLPQSFTGNSRASEIEVSSDGRFLYASNRGYDSVTIFSIAADSGLLTYIDAEESSGKTPRFFTLSPNGRHLYALNEDSDTIVQFNLDSKTGKLHATGFSLPSGSPVCMVFSPSAI